MSEADLFRRFAEHVLGKSLDEATPEYMSGWQVVEALWPMNERFRPNIIKIRSLPYDSAFEREADDAIERAAFSSDAAWGDISAGAWRVLLERQQQALVFALANEVEGSPVMPVPSEFSKAERSMAAMIFLLYRMTLPWPPGDRSGFELPSGSAKASLRPH